ncbi:MAG: hypothetical protein GEV05_24325 [Betaproteobacteria bacterium]|nr:hypothetical protein [Betaproteobacteria bacterium]
MGNFWTTKEVAYLRDAYAGDVPMDEICVNLPRHSESSIRGQATHRKFVRPRKKWDRLQNGNPLIEELLTLIEAIGKAMTEITDAANVERVYFYNIARKCRTNMGVESLQAALAALGKKLIIVDAGGTDGHNPAA